MNAFDEPAMSRYGCPHCEVRLEIIVDDGVHRDCPECDYTVPGWDLDHPDTRPIDMGEWEL